MTGVELGVIYALGGDLQKGKYELQKDKDFFLFYPLRTWACIQVHKNA